MSRAKKSAPDPIKVAPWILPKEIIYMLIRFHQITAWSRASEDHRKTVLMLRATEFSSDLKEWLNQQMGANTDQKFIEAVQKMFPGKSEVKL